MISFVAKGNRGKFILKSKMQKKGLSLATKPTSLKRHLMNWLKC